MAFIDRYSDAPYVVKLKAPILRTVTYVFIGLLPLVIINSLINKQYSIIAGSLVMAAVNSYNIYLLYKGRYSRAASLSLFLFTLNIISSAQMIGYNGEHTFLVNVLYVIVVSTYAMLFANTTKSVIIYSSAALISYIIVIIRSFLSGSVTTMSVSVNKQLIIPSVIMLMVLVMIILVRNILDKVIDETLSRLEESRRYTEKLSGLVESATGKLSLAQSMEEQAAETAVTSEKIEQRTGRITGSISDLSVQYEESLNSLGIIKSKMSELDEVAVDQSANITQTSAAMEQMAASIKNVSKVVESKMYSVTKLQKSTQEGSENINSTIKSFEKVTELLDGVKNLISIISGIASRTNLLAMNAAIEAAHAGDAGKGFAVVADEVRKLAESSAVNARQVGETIQKLMDAIIQSGKDISESGNFFNLMGNEVTQVEQAMNSINSSVRELAAGGDEIIRSTAILNDLTVKMTDVVRDVKTQEHSVHDNVENMGVFVSSVKQEMNEIDGETEHIRSIASELRGKCNTINTFVHDFTDKLKKIRE